ncbi:hypothetical protein [Actinoplanes sp. NPDC049118]|uniref:hypothetical protein n=1 Tax=Actinoplanes sp. NPDC049118 TaxID=3155769 RepID=UPI003407724B
MDRHSLRTALLAAGLPPESFQLAGVHEATDRPTDFWFMRPAPAGGWELGSYERGRFEVRETHATESAAARRLYEILVPPVG